MKKKSIIFCILSIFSMLLFVTGCTATNSSSSSSSTLSNMSKAVSSSSDVNVNKKTVIATTFATYDWAKNIAKDSPILDIKYLVDSNVDLHSYTPSAEDIVQYKNADLVICIGGESEEWIEDLNLNESNILSLMNCVDKKEEELVEGMQKSDHEEEHEDEGPEYDEHIWLSIMNAEKCVSAISDAFSKIDASNSSLYAKNLSNYVDNLVTMDKRYATTVSAASNKVLLFGDRFPFRYMVDDYDLKYYAAFIGCSAESEASFETIKFLADKVNELGLKHICVIGSNHDIANTIIRNTNSKDQDIVEFDSMQSISNSEADNKSYLNIMLNNLNVLKNALS